MAKKQSDLGGIFKKTEGGKKLDTSDLDTGNIKAVGVGLREGEIEALENLGRELGDFLNADKIARNAITRIAVRRLLESYLSGELQLAELAEYFERPERPQPKLKL